MQKAFDLIVERLGEKKSNYNAETEAFWNFREAINIVNQVAEEYTGKFTDKAPNKPDNPPTEYEEVCEWRELRNSHRYMGSKLHNHAEQSVRMLGWKYCPYCGKQIKVVE